MRVVVEHVRPVAEIGQIAPVSAGNRVIAPPGTQRIRPVAADQRVTSHVRCQDIARRVAGEKRIKRAGRNHHVFDPDHLVAIDQRSDRAGLAGQKVHLDLEGAGGVAAQIGPERVIAIAAVERVRARPPDQRVVAIAAKDLVIAGAVGDRVIAFPAIDRVIAAAPVEPVVIGVPVQRVVSGVGPAHLFDIADRVDKRIAVPGARGGAGGKVCIHRAHARTVIAQGVPATRPIQRVIALAQDETLVPAAAQHGVGLVAEADFKLADQAEPVHRIGAAIAIHDHSGRQVGIHAADRRVVHPVIQPHGAGAGPEADRVIAGGVLDTGPAVVGHRQVIGIVETRALDPKAPAIHRVCHICHRGGAIGPLVDGCGVGLAVDRGRDRRVQIPVIKAPATIRRDIGKADRVIARPRQDLLPPLGVVAGVQQVVPVTAFQPVAARAAVQCVIARAADQRVIAAQTGDRVIATQAIDVVIPRGPGQRVRSIGCAGGADRHVLIPETQGFDAGQNVRAFG